MYFSLIYHDESLTGNHSYTVRTNIIWRKILKVGLQVVLVKWAMIWEPRTLSPALPDWLYNPGKVLVLCHIVFKQNKEAEKT